ncbi:MAG: RNA methyltransferase [Luteitalea sp.]|nr:RNA methyltransferase [Luteitalea sp.]
MSRATTPRLETITSRRNPLVETFRRAARARPATTILLDGVHLVEEALAAGVTIEVAAWSERVLQRNEGRALARALQAHHVRIVPVSDDVLAAMSPSTTSSGLVALAHVETIDWQTLASPSLAFVVVAVSVQDPGNLGALVRVADAAGVDGVVACGHSADPFGWKALRGAMGSAFRVCVVRERSIQRTLDELRDRGLRLVAAGPRGGTMLHACDFRRPTAVVLGGEGQGLDTAVLGAADEMVTIPMRPPVESLNVTVAGALILFEAARQRGLVPHDPRFTAVP